MHGRHNLVTVIVGIAIVVVGIVGIVVGDTLSVLRRRQDDALSMMMMISDAAAVACNSRGGRSMCMLLWIVKAVVADTETLSC